MCSETDWLSVIWSVRDVKYEPGRRECLLLSFFSIKEKNLKDLRSFSSLTGRLFGNTQMLIQCKDRLFFLSPSKINLITSFLFLIRFVSRLVRGIFLKFNCPPKKAGECIKATIHSFIQLRSGHKLLKQTTRELFLPRFKKIKKLTVSRYSRKMINKL